MIKYNEVVLVYTCPASPILGIQMDRSYRILKKDKVFYITDGNVEIEIDEFVLKMLFTPKDHSWDEVDLINEIRNKK